MTATITVKWEHPSTDAPLAAQGGSIYVQPMQGWIAGDATVNVTRERHAMIGGQAVVSIPDDNARVWQFENFPSGSAPYTEHVLVPAGIGAVAYTDLVKVDASSGQPSPEELANALELVSGQTVTSGAVVDGALILTRGDGVTVNAGTVAGPKGDSLTITTQADGIYSMASTSEIVTPGEPGTYQIGA